MFWLRLSEMKMSISRRTFLGSTSVFLASPSFAAAEPATQACPGVNPATGARAALSSPAVDPSPRAAARPVPAQWRETAMDIIALFESGRRDRVSAYGNVSATDVISLGYLQWNHNAGSLYDTLLRGASAEMIDAAPRHIRGDVRELSRVSSGGTSRTRARAVLESWKTRGGAILPEASTALRAWLLSEPMRRRQDDLLDRRLSSALGRSDAWQAAFGMPTNDRSAQRAFYSFVDIEVFNGDLDGLWAQHVKDFRSGFRGDAEVMDHIAGWVSDCVAFEFKGQVHKDGGKYTPQFTKLYRRKETPLSVADWRERLAAGDPAVDRAAINLIVLGYLRALRSNGKDAPRGFAGVFELDVLNRRGMMATGRGVLSGQKKVTVLFSL